MQIPIKISEPLQPVKAKRFALWDLGFRPFYLAASCFAAVSIGLWALQFYGALGQAYLSGPIWHAHEMLFGFTLAILVGFLFTAGKNWSGQATPTGGLLAALVLLWVAGRLLVLTPLAWTAAIVNSAFPLAAAIALAVPFIRSNNRRNYFFVLLLVLMSAAQLLLHLSQLGVVSLPGWVGVQLGLDIMLIVLAVMAGRVVPMFTNNAIPGAGASKLAWLEKLAVGSALLLLVSDLFPLQPQLHAAVVGIAAAIHLGRWLLWRPWKTIHTPLVWVLHLAYAWLVVHLVLRCLADLAYVPTSMATHALTVGAIGGMMIGMMTRTALGHTGRPLGAGRIELVVYIRFALAAVVRVLVPALVPQWSLNAILLSGFMWSLAFSVYAVGYWPILSRARVDGLPG